MPVDWNFNNEQTNQRQQHKARLSTVELIFWGEIDAMASFNKDDLLPQDPRCQAVNMDKEWANETEVYQRQQETGKTDLPGQRTANWHADIQYNLWRSPVFGCLQRKLNKKSPLDLAGFSNLAPPTGLEPVTYGLTVRRSTD